MCPVLRNRNTRNVDNEKHVTRVSAKVAFTYGMELYWSNVWIRASFEFFPCRRHARYVYVRRDILFRVRDSFWFNHVRAVGSPHLAETFNCNSNYYQICSLDTYKWTYMLTNLVFSPYSNFLEAAIETRTTQQIYRTICKPKYVTSLSLLSTLIAW